MARDVTWHEMSHGTRRAPLPQCVEPLLNRLQLCMSHGTRRAPLPQCVERLLNRLQLCMSHGTRCHMARDVTWHEESPTAPVCRASVESSTTLHVTWHEESPTAPVCRASVESSTALHVTWHQESPTAPVCRASVESSTTLHVTWHEESPLPQCVERLLNRLQLCMSHGTRCHMARGEPHCPSVSSVC